MFFDIHIGQVCNDNRNYRNVCNMSFVSYRPFSQKARSTVEWARWRHRALLRLAPRLSLALGPHLLGPALIGPERNAQQCCHLVYIPNLNILVYFRSAWYINFWYMSKIWYILGIFLSEGLFEILNQISCYTAKHEERIRKWFQSYIKKFSDFFNTGVSVHFG